MKKIVAATLAVAAAVSLGACSSTRSDTPDVAVVLFPGVGTAEQLQSGCWATFFDERNFNGGSLDPDRPVELQTLDRESAKQLKRDIKSVITGPRATLTLYEKQVPVGRARSASSRRRAKPA
jgi:hypothetical protein